MKGGKITSDGKDGVDDEIHFNKHKFRVSHLVALTGSSSIECAEKKSVGKKPSFHFWHDAEPKIKVECDLWIYKLGSSSCTEVIFRFIYHTKGLIN